MRQLMDCLIWIYTVCKIQLLSFLVLYRYSTRSRKVWSDTVSREILILSTKVKWVFCVRVAWEMRESREMRDNKLARKKIYPRETPNFLIKVHVKYWFTAPECNSGTANLHLSFDTKLYPYIHLMHNIWLVNNKKLQQYVICCQKKTTTAFKISFLTSWHLVLIEWKSLLKMQSIPFWKVEKCITKFLRL